jgi:hypothetical protein
VAVVAFGVTAGSVTTGAVVVTTAGAGSTMVGGGSVATSRVVVVSLTVRSVEQLDIQPREMPTQAAKVMFVRIFINALRFL